MSEQHITVGEFTRWMELLRDQNKDILVEVRKTNGRVTALETERVVALETEYKVVKRTAAVISGAIALIISVGGFVLTLIKW